MSTSQKTYLARNEEGHLCGYDEKTHRCVSVPLYTGCDVEYVRAHEKEWLGQLDPAFKSRRKSADRPDIL